MGCSIALNQRCMDPEPHFSVFNAPAVARSLLLIAKSGITAAFVAISGARSRDCSDSRLAALAWQGDVPLSLLLPPASAAEIA
jgi:hypothetical protein